MLKLSDKNFPDKIGQFEILRGFEKDSKKVERYINYFKFFIEKINNEGKKIVIDSNENIGDSIREGRLEGEYSEKIKIKDGKIILPADIYGIEGWNRYLIKPVGNKKEDYTLEELKLIFLPQSLSSNHIEGWEKKLNELGIDFFRK